MPRSLGVPGCPKCKGAGVVDGETRTIVRQDGSKVKYPTVYRCSCLEAKSDQGEPPAPAGPDAQKRAAGEKED